MSSIEETGVKLFGGLFIWGLLIYGICWVVKQAVLKIVENAGPLIMVGAGIVGVVVLVAVVKGQVRWARDRAAFLRTAGPTLKALETELSEKQTEMQKKGWERDLARLEAKLTANRG